MKETIILVCGAFHYEWCWNEHFIPYFKEKGYNLHVHALSKEAKNLKDSMKILRENIKKIDTEFIFITHSMGNLFINEFLKTYKDCVPKSMVFLMPFPIENRIKNLFFTNKNYIKLTREEFFFSGRVNNAKKYIDKMNKEPLSIRMLPVIYSSIKKIEFNVPILTIYSKNDNCLLGESVMESAKLYKSKIVVLDDVCHDCMLDPEWKLVADLAIEFIDN